MTDNKLIAEFMGVHDEISLDSIAGNIHSWSDAPFFYITEDSKEKVIEGVAKYSKYHTSWDWLMPVVEKIECTHDDKGDCFNVMMEAFECTISGLALTLCLNGHSKMDATYKAVVEFIKEHQSLDQQVYLSKYTCDSCGDRTESVCFDEDKDINECMDCM